MAPSHQQKHQAGRHLAVAQALLHAYEAKLVGPMTFIEVAGRRVQVQVAAQGAWQISDVDRPVQATADVVVLVDISGATPEFYVVPADDLRVVVRRRHEEFMARVGGRRPQNPDSKHSTIDPPDVQRWKDGWSLFA
jgi:hypothetical protein